MTRINKLLGKPNAMFTIPKSSRFLRVGLKPSPTSNGKFVAARVYHIKQQQYRELNQEQRRVPATTTKDSAELELPSGHQPWHMEIPELEVSWENPLLI